MELQDFQPGDILYQLYGACIVCVYRVTHVHVNCLTLTDIITIPPNADLCFEIEILSIA